MNKRRFRSLSPRLNAIFLGFLLLVCGSVAATSMTVHTQLDDVHVINLASRQRQLTQKMIWLALGQPDRSEITFTVQLFEQTLYTLRDGGTITDMTGQSVVLPSAPDTAIRRLLDDLITTWKTFQPELQSGDAETLQAQTAHMMVQIDSLVSAFESRAQAKLGYLQLIQLVFLVDALLLLAWGYLVIRRRVLRPLMILRAATQQIASGRLADPLPPMVDDELGDLGKAFESMRTELVIAKEHLEARVTQRTRELVSAFEFSQEIAAQLDLDRLLQSVTERARALMQAREASLCLLTPDGDYLETLAGSGWNTAVLPGERQCVKQGFTARVVEDGHTVVAETECGAGCTRLKACAQGQYVAVPLRLGERRLGALCAVRQSGEHFDPDETRALNLLANSAAIAITNARLAEAKQRHAERAATLAERERLAAELHDNLAQTLSFLGLKTDQASEMIGAGQDAVAIAELRQVKSAIDMAYGQVRAALIDLRETPVELDDFAQRLTTDVTNFQDEARISVELTIAETSMAALPRVCQTQALHIVREALTNIRRHANAHHVRIRVEHLNDEICLCIEDDGTGFDPGIVTGNGHLGLTIMRTRAERSGGQLCVESTPGAGTRISVRFPVQSAWLTDKEVVS